MPKLKQDMKQLREKDVKSLRTELAASQTDLQKARVNFAFGRLKDTSNLNALRKNIARLQTLLREKEHTNV